MILFLEGLAFFSYVVIVWNDYENFGNYLPIVFISSVIPFLFIVWGVILLNELIVIFAFLFKLSFFPFVWWFPFLSSFLNFFLFFILGIVNKIFPLLMIFLNHLVSFNVLFFMSILTIFISLINLIMFQNDLKVFFAWSSNINFGWIIILMSQVWLGGLVYLVIYVSLISLLFLYIEENGLFFDQFLNNSINTVLIILVVLVSFLGLPPFLGFLYKFILINSLVNFDYMQLSALIMITLIMLLTFNSFVYINILFKLNVLKHIMVYNNVSSSVLLGIIMYILISISLLSL
uniref:NADH-ubiquinone oxidoreductase chain 2 n=1 Tax=Vermiviatum covidum TaxID=3348911 RepID=A0A8K1X7A7_9PLAT|nr:NADH dehydrogenase subunit 2 [Humbertium sp. MNHN JL090]